MRHLEFRITAPFAGKKIEWFLRGDQGISHRVVIQLKKLPEGILLNGRHARTIDRLAEGDLLEINLPEEPRPMYVSQRAVEIAYEDDDLLVYNKPADMPCHMSGGHYNDTLANVYAAHCLEKGETVTTFRPINRLDKDTTGGVVVAKNQIAAGKLWKQVQKRYLALVEGRLEQEEGVIDLPILREVPYEMRRVVDPDGQEAITQYRVLARGEGHTLVECILHTGRTHQIRVHFSYLGHPLAGDTFYGGSAALLERQALHCGWVSFPHPVTGEAIQLSLDMHNDMKWALEKAGCGRFE